MKGKIAVNSRFHTDGLSFLCGDLLHGAFQKFQFFGNAAMRFIVMLFFPYIGRAINCPVPCNTMITPPPIHTHNNKHFRSR
jgi:hypothetical protein